MVNNFKFTLVLTVSWLTMSVRLLQPTCASFASTADAVSHRRRRSTRRSRTRLTMRGARWKDQRSRAAVCHVRRKSSGRNAWTVRWCLAVPASRRWRISARSNIRTSTDLCRSSSCRFSKDRIVLCSPWGNACRIASRRFWLRTWFTDGTSIFLTDCVQRVTRYGTASTDYHCFYRTRFTFGESCRRIEDRRCSGKGMSQAKHAQCLFYIYIYVCIYIYIYIYIVYIYIYILFLYFFMNVHERVTRLRIKATKWANYIWLLN